MIHFINNPDKHMKIDVVINSVTQWRHMASQIRVNIGSGNGLLPDGKLPEVVTWTTLTNHQ